MIALSPIWAIALRHLRLFRRDPNLMLMYLYWPLLDIFTWGFLGAWIQQSNAQFHNYEAAAILAVLLWQIVGRGCNTMGLSFSEELMANNVVNLFSLPLKILEWMAGMLLFTAIMIFTTAFVCMFIVYFLYQLPFGYLVTTFFIFMPPLFLCAIWVGFTCLQIIILWGKRGIELGFVVCWFLMPFCGVYYPVEILPRWGQVISTWLPMTYIFEGMRGYVMHNQNPTPYLIKGYILGALFAICAVLLFIYCFNRSKQKGLARLSD